MLTSDARSHAATGQKQTRIDRWELKHAALTDVGKKREVNEDYFLLDPKRQLYLIADGMGGHAGGEVASRIAAETVGGYFEELDAAYTPESMPRRLVEAIKVANSALFEKVESHPELEGMGTTVVALAFTPGFASWAHVGDSRLYRLRDGRVSALTRDHSLLEQALQRQNLAPEEADDFAEHFPYRNVVTRALGTRRVVEVDTDSEPLVDGDLFAMTTDGVHDVIGTERFAGLLVEHRTDCERACQAVADETLRTGAPDNLAIACVRVRAS